MEKNKIIIWPEPQYILTHSCSKQKAIPKDRMMSVEEMQKYIDKYGVPECTNHTKGKRKKGTHYERDILKLLGYKKK